MSKKNLKKEIKLLKKIIKSLIDDKDLKVVMMTPVCAKPKSENEEISKMTDVSAYSLNDNVITPPGGTHKP